MHIHKDGRQAGLREAAGTGLLLNLCVVASSSVVQEHPPAQLGSLLLNGLATHNGHSAVTAGTSEGMAMVWVAWFGCLEVADRQGSPRQHPYITDVVSRLPCEFRQLDGLLLNLLCKLTCGGEHNGVGPICAVGLCHGGLREGQARQGSQVRREHACSC